MRFSQTAFEAKVKSNNYKPTFNTLRLRQNGRRIADDTFKRIFVNETIIISTKISLKFVPKGPIVNIPALVQIMAWRRPGDELLSEPMTISLLTHICVTRPQWVNTDAPAYTAYPLWAEGDPVIRNNAVSLVVSLNNRSTSRRSETQWHSCRPTVMPIQDTPILALSPATHNQRFDLISMSRYIIHKHTPSHNLAHLK